MIYAEAFQWHEQQRSGLGAELWRRSMASCSKSKLAQTSFLARVASSVGLSSIAFHTASFSLRILSSLTSLRSCTMRGIRSIGVDVRRVTANKARRG